MKIFGYGISTHGQISIDCRIVASAMINFSNYEVTQVSEYSRSLIGVK